MEGSSIQELFSLQGWMPPLVFSTHQRPEEVGSNACQGMNLLARRKLVGQEQKCPPSVSFYRLLAEGVAHIRGRFYYLQWSVPKVHFPSSKIQMAAYEGKAQAFSSCSVHKPGCLSWIHTRIQKKCYDVLIFYKSDSWWFIVFPGSVFSDYWKEWAS